MGTVTFKEMWRYWLCVLCRANEKMEYLTLKTSCLVSIMIPINFAVGEYILFSKEKKIAHWPIDIVLIVVSSVMAYTLHKKGFDPYLSFILVGSIVVAIMENSLFYRKERMQLFYNPLILCAQGILIIILPYTTFFYRAVLNGVVEPVKIICYFVYLCWGSERGGFAVLRWFRMSDKDKINEQNKDGKQQ